MSRIGGLAPCEKFKKTVLTVAEMYFLLCLGIQDKELKLFLLLFEVSQMVMMHEIHVFCVVTFAYKLLVTYFCLQ